MTLKILDVVRRKEMTPLAISKELGIRFKVVCDRLKAMEAEGILVSRARTKGTFYGIAGSRVAKVFEQVLEFPERRLRLPGPDLGGRKRGLTKNGR